MMTKFDKDGYWLYLLQNNIERQRMNVSLTHELDKWVHEKVKDGFYNSASEVVRESLRLLKDREQQKEALLKELRAELRLGVEQVKSGLSEEFTALTVEKIKAAGRKKLRK